ncbi:MAG: transketolase C-terminal domain-containing protein, partial [Elusimicrobiota bacterium]
MKQFIEGAVAIARTVKLARPGVISAYPITPQTHIVEELAQIVANGELKSEFINVESEHSAASVVLGAAASGVRSYSASSSQGLILMSEVLFNIAGMRLPLVICCVNRAVSAPINIWNDHQDSMMVRDSGWFQFFAEDVQEACDLHLAAYRISENKEILLPAMICIDGYILSHGLEVVDFPTQEEVDKFLLPYDYPFKLNPEKPLTLGVLAGPDYYTETRYAIAETMKQSLKVIPDVFGEFTKTFNRELTLIEEYALDDADVAIVAMGSVCGTIKDAIDRMRKKGDKVGLLRIVSYRPFPQEDIYNALKKIPKIAVIDKSVSLGSTTPLCAEIKALFQDKPEKPQVSTFVLGLGGRDITQEDIEKVVGLAKTGQTGVKFIGIREENIFKSTAELEEW